MLLSGLCLAIMAILQLAVCIQEPRSLDISRFSGSLAGRANIIVGGKPLLEEEKKGVKEGDVEVVREGKVVGVKDGDVNIGKDGSVTITEDDAEEDAAEGEEADEAAVEGGEKAAAKAGEVEAVKESEKFKNNAGITIDPNRGVTNIGGNLGITKGSDGSQSIGGKSGINIGAPAGAKKAKGSNEASSSVPAKGETDAAKGEKADAAKGEAATGGEAKAGEAKEGEVEAVKEAEKFKDNLGITIDPNRGTTNIGGNLGITKGADGSQSVGGKSGINIGAPAKKANKEAATENAPDAADDEEGE
ncbi:hypothetical protein RB595_007092 [Gaeumannomyces hyphopodioides]